jgi:hypothetical protein
MVVLDHQTRNRRTKCHRPDWQDANERLRLSSPPSTSTPLRLHAEPDPRTSLAPHHSHGRLRRDQALLPRVRVIAPSQVLASSLPRWPRADSPAIPAAKLLATTIGRIAPLSSVTVQVPSAFLSFDYRGVPFVEPCYTSAIVKGVNDQGWKQGLDAQAIALDGVEGPRYRQYVWDRCCPGLDFTGDLPPVLEVSSQDARVNVNYTDRIHAQGVAYELSEAHWTALTSDPSLAPLLPVQCYSFASGDPTGKTGTLIAHLPGENLSRNKVTDSHSLSNRRRTRGSLATSAESATNDQVPSTRPDWRLLLDAVAAVPRTSHPPPPLRPHIAPPTAGRTRHDDATHATFPSGGHRELDWTGLERARSESVGVVWSSGKMDEEFHGEWVQK